MSERNKAHKFDKRTNAMGELQSGVISWLFLYIFFLDTPTLCINAKKALDGVTLTLLMVCLLYIYAIRSHSFEVPACDAIISSFFLLFLFLRFVAFFLSHSGLRTYF